MSKLAQNKIVLEGHEGQRLPGLSLYMTFETEQSKKDVLFEFAGDLGNGTSIDPRDYPDNVWDVFVSYGRILKEPRDRTRKILFSGVSASEAIEKIRDEVMRHFKGYDAIHPPAWWTPIAPAEIEQVKVMLAKGVDLSHEREKLEAAYSDDAYILELKYDGHRCKAHFFFKAGAGAVRFDSRRQSDVSPYFVENTGNLPHISNVSLATAEYLNGTILDGEIVHPGGLASIGSVMGALPEKALSWQLQNGWATFMAFDCVRVRGTWIHKLPWRERRQYVESVVDIWKKSVDPSLAEFIRATSFWEGSEAKKAMRTWALENGYEGTILKKADAHYAFGSRSWSWIKDKKEKRFSCIVMGFENSQSEKYGPKGWIEHIKIGQYHKGTLIEIGQVGTMDEEHRKWFSENRARAMGMVIEVEAQEQIKGTWALRHPRFIAPRIDLRPEDCVVGSAG